MQSIQEMFTMCPSQPQPSILLQSPPPGRNVLNQQKFENEKKLEHRN